MMSSALEGLTVLDFTRLLPGPLATLHFADHGARVVKVEDLARGDYARQDMAFGVSMSHLFHMVNRGKRSIAIDARNEAGRDAIRHLVAQADVVVENFRPGTMDRLGLGYADLSAVKPDLVYCSISAYGARSPRAHMAAHDINMCAIAGVSDQLGAAGGAPSLSNFQIADIAGGGLGAVNAILTALFQRERTGRGAYLDVSMTDVILGHNVMPTATGKTFHREAPRGGDMLTGALACYGYYQTQDDRWLAVGALEPQFWRRLCEALDRPDLIPRHLSAGDAADDLRATLADIFRTKPLADWTAVFDETDCCVTAVLTPNEAAAEGRANGTVVDFEDPEDGSIRHHVGSTAAHGGPQGSQFVVRPAPRHGADTHDVLEEFGVDPDEVQALEAAGAIKPERASA
ncbi:MAG: CaiB/BaiF CoA-transferase family protein [Pseudomonadota bacterium]